MARSASGTINPAFGSSATGDLSGATAKRIVKRTAEAVHAVMIFHINMHTAIAGDIYFS
jgi:hypothetical protein